jgi:DNA-binding XRE family transcriptional regulator
MVEPRSLWVRVNALRQMRGWKWYGLAVDAGLVEETFKRWGQGRNKPSLDAVQRVAKAFSMTVDELIAGLPRLAERPSSDPPPPPSVSSDRHRFDPWKPASGPSFVGRTNILEHLAEAYERGGSVNLPGERRIGKSSLLAEWGRIACERGIEVVHVSSEQVPGLSPDALVEAITGKRAEPGADSSAEVLLRWLEQPGRVKPLVLIDEFDALAISIEDRFFQRLRGMVGEGLCCFVLATCKDLSELSTPGRTSPFDNLLETIQVGLLDPWAADQLAGRCEELSGAQGVSLLRHWAGAHPFYLQLGGHHFMRALLEGASIERGIDEFRGAAGRYLDALWKHASPREQEALITGEGEKKVLRRMSRRGLLTEHDLPFGQVFTSWLEEMTR